MPAKSDKQRRFMGAELGRKRKGQKTETGMSEDQLRDFAAKATTMKAKPHGKHGHGGKHGSMMKPRDKKHAAKKMGARKHGY